ncbi:MAG: hypothetical protein AAGH41_03555 [Pseudomonadota bacterium]
MDNKTPARGDQLGLDELVDDVFGLNVRGLKTIIDTLVRPRLVFDAARQADWSGAYTPSLRLVFSILTVLGFFTFFWAGEDTAFYQVLEKAITLNADTPLTAEEMNAQITRTFGIYSAALPFVLIIIHGLFSQIIRVWGQGTPGVARLRLHMTAIVPGLVLTLLSTLATPFVPDLMITLTLVLLAAVLFADAATAWRGSVVAQGKGSRLMKSLVFAIGSSVATAIASSICIRLPDLLPIAG